jgi:hypothetical protein
VFPRSVLPLLVTANVPAHDTQIPTARLRIERTRLLAPNSALLHNHNHCVASYWHTGDSQRRITTTVAMRLVICHRRRDGCTELRGPILHVLPYVHTERAPEKGLGRGRGGGGMACRYWICKMVSIQPFRPEASSLSAPSAHTVCCVYCVFRLILTTKQTAATSLNTTSRSVHLYSRDAVRSVSRLPLLNGAVTISHYVVSNGLAGE